jgi:hypothetical protein
MHFCIDNNSCLAIDNVREIPFPPLKKKGGKRRKREIKSDEIRHRL